MDAGAGSEKYLKVGAGSCRYPFASDFEDRGGTVIKPVFDEP